MSPKEFEELRSKRVLQDLENIKKRKAKALPNLDKAIEYVNENIKAQDYSDIVCLTFDSNFLSLDDFVTVKELTLLLKKYLKDKGWLVKHESFEYTQYLTLYPNTFLNRIKLLFKQ